MAVSNTVNDLNNQLFSLQESLETVEQSVLSQNAGQSLIMALNQFMSVGSPVNAGSNEQYPYGLMWLRSPSVLPNEIPAIRIKPALTDVYQSFSANETLSLPTVNGSLNSQKRADLIYAWGIVNTKYAKFLQAIDTAIAELQNQIGLLQAQLDAVITAEAQSTVGNLSEGQTQSMIEAAIQQATQNYSPPNDTGGNEISGLLTEKNIIRALSVSGALIIIYFLWQSQQSS